LAREDWALLPHTAGFVDPLHSTGIAHSLCGIERLVQILDQQWQDAARTEALAGYGETLEKELDLTDELVATCFTSFDNFDLLVVASMLYFAAATTYERLRCEGNTSLAFLCADQDRVRSLLHDACAVISQHAHSSRDNTIDQVRRQVASLIAPINHVGLLDDSVSNMYRHTVAPM
jgi:FADH2 O2-dependent halogenase